MSDLLRVAVLTDLHACVDSKKGDAVSWVTADSKGDRSDPFIAAKGLIEKEGLTADLLLCCGDMTDRANITSQIYAWDQINELGQLLKVDNVYGTAGNHDLDSRPEGDDINFDPKGGLQSLTPSFPCRDEKNFLNYWAKNYFIHNSNEGKYVVLNLNSSAYHGYANHTDNEEWKHGRISDFTIKSIKKDLSEIDLKGKLKIAFHHHHPIKWNQITDKDYSEMRGGSSFLELLGDISSDQWLVIHGHKHFPEITYGPGSSNSPTIISAGSFSSKRLYSASEVSNQFYIIEIERKALEKFQLNQAGKVYAWTWTLTGNDSLWKPSWINDGIPYGAGFGNKDAVSIIANQINQLALNEAYLKYEEIEKALPKIQFLLPSDMRNLLDCLRTDYQITTQADNCGKFSMLSKKR